MVTNTGRKGWVIFVERLTIDGKPEDGCVWLGRRVYLTWTAARIVRANILRNDPAGRYKSVEVHEAKPVHFDTAYEVS